ncbi:MAG: hypothetical protein V1691_01245 [Chloroflexota bacterium]
METCEQGHSGKRAYVLIDTEADRAFEVVKSLRTQLGIPMADIVDGPYRVIAVIESNNIAAIAKKVLVDIRKLSGVKDLIVYMARPEAGALQSIRPGANQGNA